jgi:hypothetical protein
MGRETMSPNDVTELVRTQIAGGKSLPNPHRVDLDRCLVWPTRIQVINRSVRDGRLEDVIETVWLVLEEGCSGKDGYRIVFNAQMAMFGLASPGFESDRHLILCGYYGDFPTTLESM